MAYSSQSAFFHTLSPLVQCQPYEVDSIINIFINEETEIWDKAKLTLLLSRGVRTQTRVY